MARFDVYAFQSDRVPLVVDVQADLLSDLETRVVVPLVLKAQAQNEVVAHLKPVIELQGDDYILMTTDIGTIRRQSLGEKITNIEDTYRQTVVSALDFLFQGF